MQIEIYLFLGYSPIIAKKIKRISKKSLKGFVENIIMHHINQGCDQNWSAVPQNHADEISCSMRKAPFPDRLFEFLCGAACQQGKFLEWKVHDRFMNLIGFSC